uniref:Uncharacterized protein n=1 Tax=Anguilla anguilla TaxID=7936 RepID=A0A0E9U048_ANGAN
MVPMGFFWVAIICDIDLTTDLARTIHLATVR